MTTAYVPATVTTLPPERRDAIRSELRLQWRDHLTHLSDNRGRGADTCSACHLRRMIAERLGSLDLAGTGVHQIDVLDALEAAEREVARLNEAADQQRKIIDAEIDKSPHEDFCLSATGGECNCWHRRLRNRLT